MVGEIDTTEAAGELRRDAVLWVGKAAPVLLTDYLAAAGLADPVAGWRLTLVHQISRDGRVIAGSGLRPDGLTQAFVAVVPEPAVGGLLLLLGAFVAGRRRGGASRARRA